MQGASNIKDFLINALRRPRASNAKQLYLYVALSYKLRVREKMKGCLLGACASDGGVCGAYGTEACLRKKDWGR